jgi:phenylacetate-CoA ligase
MKGDLIAILRQQLARVMEYGLYRDKYNRAGIRAEDIKTMDDFRSIPYTDFKELEKDAFETNPPFGSLYDPKTTRINLTTSQRGLMPVLNTANDVTRMNNANARTYAQAGLGPNDILLTTFTHHIFPAGCQIQGAGETLGAKTISVGPGETERTMEIIRRFRVNALYTNPSLAVKLAEMGMEGIKLLFGGGEPFRSVKGYKERVRSCLGEGAVLIDTYTLAHAMPTARECRYETGLHVVDELVYVEIIDPETGVVVDDGERGEVVITHLYKEAMPFFRFRTGDLSMMEHKKCRCGSSATLPFGVFGRVDAMLKVKGLKLYPSQIGSVLRAYPELSEKPYRLIVSQKKTGGDHLSIEIKAPGFPAAELLKADLKESLFISVDELRFVEELSAGGPVEDRRYA